MNPRSLRAIGRYERTSRSFPSLAALVLLACTSTDGNAPKTEDAGSSGKPGSGGERSGGGANSGGARGSGASDGEGGTGATPGGGGLAGESSGGSAGESGGRTGSGGQIGPAGGGGAGGTRAGSTTLAVEGTVRSTDAPGSFSPVAGAAVRVSCDTNDDGKVDAAEVANGTADAAGRYALEITCPSARTLVVRASADGHAAGYFSPRAHGDSDQLLVDLTLAAEDPVTCTDTVCTIPNGRLSVTGLGPGVRGFARAYNPVTEGELMPGGFRDDQGHVLLSGGFATVELETASGQKLETLSHPATLRLEVPFESWSVVTDVTPGNGRIDVPMYSFSEAKGTWVRDGSGFLEGASGQTLAESALPSIRSGAFTGRVMAHADVTHFSAWNVDWQTANPTCVQATLTAGGRAVPATLLTHFTTYDGGGPARDRAGADGTICRTTLRSEGPQDDFDQDGIAGETHRVLLWAQWQDRTYDFGEFDAPATTGDCGGGGCLDVGVLPLDDAHELKPALCTITGSFTSITGRPWQNEPNVQVYDETLSEAEHETCTGDCKLSGWAQKSGAFSVRTLVKGQLSVVIGHTFFGVGGEDQIREGAERMFFGCPRGPVQLRSTDGHMQLTLQLKVAGGVITWSNSWSANPRASSVTVSRGGEEIWKIHSDGGSFIESPLTYGQVPSSAVQTVPAAGPPVPLQPGDQVFVMGDYQDGLFGVSVDGAIIVP